MVSRVVALVLVVLVLVFTGFWLATRPRVAAPATSGTPVTATGSASKAPAPTAPAATPPATAGSGPAADAAAGVTLPDGYTALPYLSAQRQLVFAKAAQVLEPGKDYVAVLVTSKGAITVQLLRQDAPITVDNFVFLALHRFYNGVPFHRVLAGFMAQTGDPTGTGRGGPGYSFPDEISNRLHFDKRGVVAMANAGQNTNGSQFFITFGPTPWLDGHYNIFGQVIAGNAVLDKLQRIDPQNPEAVAALTDTLGDLSSQGIDLKGSPARTVGDTLTQALGAAPVAGQSFTIDGYRAVVGSAGGKPAVGFFPRPDTLERVVIAVKPAS